MMFILPDLGGFHVRSIEAFQTVKHARFLRNNQKKPPRSLFLRAAADKRARTGRRPDWCRMPRPLAAAFAKTSMRSMLQSQGGPHPQNVPD
jgi:hypothetical protein